MTDASYGLLPDRGLIAVEGDDARAYLQGLISNDVNRVGPERAIYAAFLTPQGKYLFDFFVVERGAQLLLDCEAARLPDFLRRLKMYRLRSRVELSDQTEGSAVAALFGPGAVAAVGLAEDAGRARPFAAGVAYVDPRLAAAGARAVLPRAEAEAALAATGLARAEAADYDRFRLGLGLADGSRDLVVEKSTLLESGFDELNGIDWDKGCYMGQELTARTRYRGLVKKRLVAVDVDGPLPQPGTPIRLDEREVGEMRSGRDGLGLALMRVEAMQRGLAAGAPFTAGQARLTPRKPGWASA